MEHISRRGFIKGSLAGVAAIPAARFAYQIDDPQTMLNMAMNSELFAASFYLAMAERLADLTDSERIIIKAMGLSDWDHSQLFRSMGGQPFGTVFYIPDVTTSKLAFASMIERMETGFVAGYLSAAQMMASSGGDELLAVTMGQIAAVESQHLALVRQIAGFLPSYAPFGFYSDAPMTDSVAWLENVLSEDNPDANGHPIEIPVPDEAEINQLRAELEALGFDSSIKAAVDL